MITLVLLVVVMHLAEGDVRYEVWVPSLDQCIQQALDVAKHSRARGIKGFAECRIYERPPRWRLVA